MAEITKKWTSLKSGDTVQIIAPASKLLNPTPENLAAALSQVKIFVEGWGLKAKISPNIFGMDQNFSSLANTDEKRFADLKEALFDPEVKAIWCLRGGYGSLRLYNKLRKFTPPKTPKLFIGFSDITLLLIYLQQIWGWNVIHGPVALQAAETRVTQEDLKQLHDLIFGKLTEIKINNLEPWNTIALKEKIIKTSVVGGNLTLISRTFGLPEQIVIKNKILFFEDVDETFRKIDGILQQLQLLKDFVNNLPAAIIIGNISAENSQEQQQIDNSLKEFAAVMATKEIPVLRCTAIGHGQFNQPLPSGPTATLTLGKQPNLTIAAGSNAKIGGFALLRKA